MRVSPLLMLSIAFYASFLAISSSRISFTVKAIMLLPERRKKA